MRTVGLLRHPDRVKYGDALLVDLGTLEDKEFLTRVGCFPLGMSGKSPMSLAIRYVAT